MGLTKEEIIWVNENLSALLDYYKNYEDLTISFKPEIESFFLL